jgi:hypothetical protein
VFRFDHLGDFGDAASRDVRRADQEDFPIPMLDARDVTRGL